jgi:hypothetical protein
MNYMKVGLEALSVHLRPTTLSFVFRYSNKNIELQLQSNLPIRICFGHDLIRAIEAFIGKFYGLKIATFQGSLFPYK